MAFLPRPIRARQWKNCVTVCFGEESAWAALVIVLWICAVIDMHALLDRQSATRTNGSASYATPPASSTPPMTVPTADAPRLVERDSRSERSRVANPARRAASVGRSLSKGLRAYTEDEVQDLIRVYAEAFGIDPAIPLAIARCESQFHWNAANRSSSARGVFQYVAGTWAATPEGRRGTSPFDAEANIRMALTHMITIGTSPWNASRACWDA